MASLYPLSHSHQLLQRLLALNKPKSLAPALHFCYLVGGNIEIRGTDAEQPFRQEANFKWLSGCDVPGSALTIEYEHEGGDQVDPAKVHTRLWLPDVDEAEVMWCGLPPAPEDLAKSLHLTSIQRGWTPQALYPPKPKADVPTFLHTMPLVSPPTTIMARINGPKHATEYLEKALHEARRYKTDREVELMAKASEITAGAHKNLMRLVGSGEVADENAAEAEFVSYCRKKGSKHQAYSPILAAGSAAGTLHYIDNDRAFPSEPTLLLVDAGADSNSYAADVTRCIPIGNGGRFTKECKEIYELVLSMQYAAFERIKPGASYEDIQRLMHDVLARGFLRLGIFQVEAASSEDDAVRKLMDEGLTSAFYPHGVGHLLGLDVHDVGGLPDGRSSEPLLKYLRLRVPLEEGFVITVEPGCYFNEHLFAPFKNSSLVNHEVLARYNYVGGVRIEDNLLVTADGFRNLTPEWLPKTVAEVEAVTTGQSA